jgi:hypothetical protein
MSFAGNRQQVESYNTQAVPQSLQGNDSPMAMRGKVTQVSVPSATGDAKSNGKLRFVLPNNNVSISRRSMFIRARCSVSFTATLPSFNGAISNSVWFQGPGNTNSSSLIGAAATQSSTASNISGYTATPILGNAYSLIQRSTIYSGSAVVDMTDYVCDLMTGLILPHGTNTPWLQYDGQIMLGICTSPMVSTALTTGGFCYWDLAIPITHSCFNSERDFPAYLLSDSNPLSIEIDLTSFSRAIGYGTGIFSSSIILDYTLSRAALCYEAVELPREFIEAQRLATKNTPFVIPQLSYLNYQMPISALTNYSAILKLSSLRAAYILPYNNATYSSLFVMGNRFFAYQRNAGDIALSTVLGIQDGTNAQLFIDGKCINQVNLDNTTMTFVALKQALKGSITDYSSSSICSAVTYKLSHFAIGIDATCFSDQSTLMGGTPVNEAQIILTNFIASATTGTYLANVIFAYDSLIIFKNGKITTKR